MRKTELSERKLEELLGELPKVTDYRKPSEIYRNISIKVEKRKRNRSTWFIPGLVTGVVIVLLFILSPTLMEEENEVANQGNDTETSMELDNAQMLMESKDSKMENNAIDPQNEVLVKEDESAADKQNPNGLNTESVRKEPSAVYTDDLEGFQAFTFEIPDAFAQVTVPVTVLTSDSESKTWFEQFEALMPKLTEETWGLAEYFPLNADLTYDADSKTVIVNVPTDHQYGYGSTGETTFMNILKRSFPMDKVKKVQFTTDGKPGINLGNYGKQIELKVEKVAKQAYFFLFSGEENRPYLVPTGDSFDTISDAVHEMSHDQSELGLSASLPKEISLALSEVNKDGNILHLKLADGTQINESFLYSLEAIMLTAKNFGYSAIRLENAGIDQIGPFILSENIPVPLAPNKKIIDHN